MHSFDIPLFLFSLHPRDVCSKCHCAHGEQILKCCAKHHWCFSEYKSNYNIQFKWSYLGKWELTGRAVLHNQH